MPTTVSITFANGHGRMPSAIVASLDTSQMLKGTIIVKVLTFFGMLGILAVQSMSAAQAQSTMAGNTIPSPIVIRVGVAWPNDSSARYLAGESPLNVGVDYALGQSGLNDSNISSVYADYLGGSANGGHLDVYGFGLSDRVYTSSGGPLNQSTGQAFFTGGGAGVYQFSDSNGSATTFGVKIFGGIEYSQRFIVQLNYLLVPGTTGLNAGGLGLQVGLRI